MTTAAAQVAQALWTGERKTRIRLQQWTRTLVIYVASALVLSLGASHGLFSVAALESWIIFVFAGLAFFYVMLRSGASQRYDDPALTELQIAFGVATVLWGYVICGDVRSATISSLMVILMFGAFSLRWQLMVRLTLCTVAALAFTILGMHRYWPGRFDLRIDMANFLIVAIMLPATSVLAVLLGNLRSRLQAQRGELKLALARIQDLATHDALTGLTNRGLAQHLVELERQRSERTGCSFALAIVDLDHFKSINDRHGHGVGDQALCAFAQEALATVRACDIVARWGGEEFLVLMPDTDAGSAVAGVERLRARVERLRLTDIPGEFVMTMSAGVVGHVRGEEIPETIARADRAMYAAKAAGRNRVVAG